MERALFSVAMSVYKNDEPAFFDRALQSITELQTVPPDEIILVADGPLSDGLNTVIGKYLEKYDFFKVIRLEKNGGLGNALKIAVDNCSHGLIARMDSDDVAVPDRFYTQLKFFKNNPATDIVGGDITEFTGEETNVVSMRKVPSSNEEIVKFLKKRCPFNHMTVMFKKSAVLSAGGYKDLFWNEDYYLWIRMFENGAVMANTGTTLVNVRTGKDMFKRRGGFKYFKSEKFLQKYMLNKKIINFGTYFTNVTKRFIVEILLPASVRSAVFKKFARNKKQV